MDPLTIELTDIAQQKIREFLALEEREGLAIYLTVPGYGPFGFQYQLDIVDPAEMGETIALDYEGFRLLVDPASAEHLGGVTVDFVERGLESGFRFDNPNRRFEDPVAQAVQDILDTQVNPSVAMHGGYIDLLDVRDDTAYIALRGGCHGCGMADVTLKQGVEVAIMNAVPEVKKVLDTTDHAAGENPYYQSQGDAASPFAS